MSFLGIEFGSGGETKRDGFKSCDIRDVEGVDYVCPAWEIDKHVEPATVDEIWSRHFFEHLTFIQGEKVLQSWYKILKPGGKVGMKLPNMEFHVQQWIRRKDKDELDWAKAGFWGWQREGETESWDVHKSGYDKETLTELLTKHNFTGIISHRSSKDKELIFEFYKPKED